MTKVSKDAELSARVERSDSSNNVGMTAVADALLVEHAAPYPSFNVEDGPSGVSGICQSVTRKCPPLSLLIQGWQRHSRAPSKAGR
jgi:hypothetical protein